MTTIATLQPGLPRIPLAIQRVPFEEIPRAAWDRLLSASPAATPFSSWTFQRAWWDAYADTAQEHYLLVTEPQVGPAGFPRSRSYRAPGSLGPQDAPWLPAEAFDDVVRAIVPLMWRAMPGASGALFMAATFHADYATILAAPDDLPEVASQVAAELLQADRTAGPGDARQHDRDVVDLRRLRGNDPATAALREALEAAGPGAGWLVRHEVEDVCPVVMLASDWETQLASLSKKARHEVRRKLRRAERSGTLRLRYLPLETSSVERLIALHQARWGADGLFSATEDGERGRAFLHRLVELEAREGVDARFHLAEVLVGERVVYALAGFDDGVTSYFYNAGMDPQARELSPGVIGTAAYIRDRLAAGRLRFDFLRGNEGYKYEWGAVDEPVHRVVATRMTGATPEGRP